MTVARRGAEIRQTKSVAVELAATLFVGSALCATERLETALGHLGLFKGFDHSRRLANAAAERCFKIDFLGRS
jgi:hypothetical protein